MSPWIVVSGLDSKMAASKALRICIVSDCYPPSIGGIENHVYALSCELARLGHSVTVVTHREVQPRRMRVEQVLPPYGVEIVRLRGLTLRLHNGGDPALDPRMVGQMARLVRERQFDIVHGHTVESPFVLALMMKSARMGRPTIVTKHSMVERPLRPPIIGALMRALMIKVMDQFTAYIAVSEPAADELCGSVARSFVVRNAIDMERFRPDPSLRAATRAPLGYRDEHIVVGFLSRFVPSKGLLDLVDIGVDLAAQNSGVRFLLVGDGPLRRRVELETSRAGLADRFLLVGLQPWAKAPHYLNAMDVFAFPSQSEGFGMALLEAMACGLPCVTTDQSGTQEIVRDGDTALAARSVDELRTGLCRLVGDAELRRRLSVAAREAVERGQGWGAVARKTEEVYRKTIAVHDAAS